MEDLNNTSEELPHLLPKKPEIQKEQATVLSPQTHQQGLVAHAIIPSTCKAETEGFQVQVQPGLHYKTLP